MISVIIPVYNVEDYLSACVDSVIAQSFSDLEILLIDDGSTDDSGNICDQYAATDSRIKAIHIANSGVANARNVGIENATGEYITFIDSDDYIAIDYLEYLYTLIRNKDADISVCDYINNGEFVKSTLESHFYATNTECMAAFLKTNEIITTPWGKLYKSSVWNNVKFDIMSQVEDAATIYKVIANTNSIVVGFDKKYFYRIRQYSATNKPFSYKDIDHIHAMEERSKFIEKNYPELLSASNAYIIYAANLALAKMAMSKMYKSEYHPYLKSLYKKYEKDFLHGHSSKSAKIFSLLASVKLNLAMRFYRMTNKQVIRKSVRAFIRNTASIVFGIEAKLRWLISNKSLNISDRPEKIAVTLTSFPERIGIVPAVIKSIISGKVKPDYIELYLANSQFPGGENDLPKALVSLKQYGLEIKWYEDIKSFKKLVPAISEHSGDIIVTADDDAYYGADWLSKLYASYKADPKAVCCHRATPFYIEDGKWKTIIDGKHFYKDASILNMQVGGAGVLYPPHSLSAEVTDKDLFMTLAPTNDDLWFWVNAINEGHKVKVVPGNRAIPIPVLKASYTSKLTDINNKGENNFEQQFKALMKHYPETELRLRDEASRVKL